MIGLGLIKVKHSKTNSVSKSNIIWAGSKLFSGFGGGHGGVGGRPQYFYGFKFKLSGCLTIKLSQAVFYAKRLR